MIFSLLHSYLSAEPISVGDKAPQIKVVTDQGETIDFGDVLSKGITVVYFYPKAMTPGCTKQSCSLRDSWDVLHERDVRIFGVSSDAVETQAEFKNKYTLPFTLIADTDKSVSKAFGKSPWSRQAYIFRDGVVVWRDLTASTGNQAEDVLAALDNL